MTETSAHPQAPWALRLLPPFPAIAHRILALVSQSDTTAHQVGDLIKLDPSFAAELLHLANSALFGIRHHVTSLLHAIHLLGMDRVKAMATFVAVHNMVRSSIRMETLRKVWIHSILTAIIAEEAARISRLERDSAYTTGLLHNLGTLGLMSAYPAEYSRMLEVSNDFGFDLLQTERDLFEIDHCAAGAFIAGGWHFPDELTSVIACHHQPPVPTDRNLGNIVKVAWRITDSLGYASFSPDKDWAFEDLVKLFPNTDASWLGQSIEDVKADLELRLAAVPFR